MCRLWSRIRYGVRWDRVDQAELALKSFSLKDVSSFVIQFDPLRGDSKSLREFWHRITMPNLRATNPKMRVQVQLQSDGCRPQFVAHLHDGRQLVFKTDGFQLPDLLMRLNRLLGLPSVGMRGEPDEDQYDRMDEAKLEAHFRAQAKKKRPIDFLS